jgi:hypothetical protein
MQDYKSRLKKALPPREKHLMKYWEIVADKLH